MDSHEAAPPLVIRDSRLEACFLVREMSHDKQGFIHGFR